MGGSIHRSNFFGSIHVCLTRGTVPLIVTHHLFLCTIQIQTLVQCECVVGYWKRQVHEWLKFDVSMSTSCSPILLLLAVCCDTSLYCEAVPEINPPQWIYFASSNSATPVRHLPHHYFRHSPCLECTVSTFDTIQIFVNAIQQKRQELL